MSDLHLVYDCPPWCATDHSVTVPAEDLVHEGKLTEAHMPDGRLILDLQMVREPGQQLPLLVVSGAFETLGIEVATLNGAEAEHLHMQLMRAAEAVRHALRPLYGRRSKSQRWRENKGKDERIGWRETRLYLAERDGTQCFYCRTPFDGMTGATTDHYVPYSVWPCNMPANLVLACEPCNTAKSDSLTWSMTAVLLAWAAREGATGRDDEGPLNTPGSPAGRDSLTSLAG